MILKEQPIAVAPVESCDAPIIVRVLRTTSEIEEVREFWERWQKHPNCDFDFYRKVLQTAPGMQRPHILVAYRGDIPEAMLIGRIEETTVDFSIGYKRIAALPVRCLTFLHGGYVGNSTAETAAEFLKSIRGALSEGEAVAVYFNHLRTDDALYREMSRVPPSFWHMSSGEQRNHRGMTLGDGADGFRRSLSSKERNNQKRREKRIQEEFKDKARIQRYASASELDRMIQDVDCVARKTYQRALGVGFEDTPSMRERLRMEAERGWLRAYVLYLDEQPCAFWMGDVYAGTFYSGFTGYDSDYSKYAPGMFLLLKAMELVCEEQAKTLRTANFGLGDAEWKQIIGNLEWQETPVYLFPRSAKGAILTAMQRGSSFLNSFGKRILGQNNSIAKVKKAWRVRLSRKGK
jgi:Acetyltransferase (GNAT) domain